MSPIKKALILLEPFRVGIISKHFEGLSNRRFREMELDPIIASILGMGFFWSHVSTNPKVKKAFTNSCSPISFARIGKDEEAMHALSAAAVIATILVPDATEAGTCDERRAMLTNERLEMVANNMMDETMMAQYGIVLDNTPKGGYKHGSDGFFKSLATFFNNQKPKHNMLIGVTLGVGALKSWITSIKSLAKLEADRQK